MLAKDYSLDALQFFPILLNGKIMLLTEDQLAGHLNDRLRMLFRSAEAYDQGDYAEATRLAGSIVKIVGDRKKKNGEENRNFISLSTRLGIKPSAMVDTSLSIAMNYEYLHGPLVILGFHIAGAAGLVPMLDGFERDDFGVEDVTPFEKWWNDPVIRDAKGNEFSRRAIIEVMRDQEDAHTDGDLDPDFAAISYKGAIGITQVNPIAPDFDTNPARVVVRQVAHEVLRTFIPSLPPKWMQTRGLKVQALVLYEIHKQDESGNYNKILDHKAIEFKGESTTSPETWQEWQNFIGEAAPTDATAEPLRDPASKNWLLQAVFMNFAPYPIEGLQMMVCMQHPVG